MHMRCELFSLFLVATVFVDKINHSILINMKIKFLHFSLLIKMKTTFLHFVLWYQMIKDHIETHMKLCIHNRL